jgi:HemY protein
MFRLFAYFGGIVLLTVALSWLADRPGTLVLEWQNIEIRTSVFRAVVMVAIAGAALIMLWSLLKQILTSPQTAAHFVRRRRQKRGIEALTGGMIAVGSGDRSLAVRYTQLARKSLPNEPLTLLLRAQTAELMGDRATARRIYEAMRNTPDTELLGLRGLFLEAKREGEDEAARQYAERALAINPRLGWSAQSLFELQCREQNWEGALETLGVMRRNALIDKGLADRRRAVLLTAQAMELEDSDSARALALALEAHGLARDLVPAAAIAGRLLASQGATGKAAKVLQKTWKRSPHPDLATAYSFARIGDSPRDRLQRIRELARLTPNSNEGPIAIAAQAIDAQEWDLARRVLAHLVDERPTQRVCTLMARIEGGQNGDTGRVREWLARAVHAPRDPAWIADGHIAQKWAPISPVTGELDAFEWRVPEERFERQDGALLVEELASSAKAQQLALEHAAREAETASEAARLRRPPLRDAADIDAEPVQPAPRSEARPVVATTAGEAYRPAPAKRSEPAVAEEALPEVVRPPTNVRFKMASGPTNGSHGIRNAGKDAVVSPRAPDDPGPDAAEDDDKVTRFRGPSGKRQA